MSRFTQALGSFLTPAVQRLANVMAGDLPYLRPSKPDEAGRFFITDNFTGQRFAVTLKPVPSEPNAAPVREVA